MRWTTGSIELLIADSPLLILVLTFVAMSLAGAVGTWLARRRGGDLARTEVFAVVQTATLTLLGLIVGFTFSMALGRYDQRKNLEEAEANAIGTEYVRADLLPPASAAQARTLLRRYLDEGILNYAARERRLARESDARVAALQTELWAAVVAPASAKPDPVTALAVSGMNDVLNSQGYTQAAWLNRIPFAAWTLRAALAIFSNVLVGFDVERSKGARMLLLILPAAVAVSCCLIADLESPRSGLIHVQPQNLQLLADSLRGQ